MKKILFLFILTAVAVYGMTEEKYILRQNILYVSTKQ